MKDKTNAKTKEEIEGEWIDAIPEELVQQYQLLSSYWNLDISEHRKKLYYLLAKWVVTEGLTQREVGIRIRFLHLEQDMESILTQAHQETQDNSYLRATQRGMGMSEEKRPSPEYERLRLLCLAPAVRLTQLRRKTEDEDKALLLIFNNEIELAQPPPFLIQSMTASELAWFTDKFLAMEYPLFAHLAAGQRLGENLTKQTLLNHVITTAEAAPAQKQEVADFKSAVSRFMLDTVTRVLTVTFKGRQAAQRWVGWQMPLARHLLKLHDYERQREEARLTNAVVKLDYYEFTVAVRKGAVTSSDMLWVLTRQLQLKVHSMLHVEMETGGINDKQWTVWIQATSCPKEIGELAFLRSEEVEIVIHHKDIHKNWPCEHCGAPDHPTKFCKTTPAEIAKSWTKHAQRIIGRLPSSKGVDNRTYSAVSTPKTLEQLRQMLQAANTIDKEEGRDAEDEMSKRASSPRRQRKQNKEMPVFPKDLEKHRLPRLHEAQKRKEATGREDLRKSGGDELQEQHGQHDDEDVDMKDAKTEDGKGSGESTDHDMNIDSTDGATAKDGKGSGDSTDHDMNIDSTDEATRGRARTWRITPTKRFPGQEHAEAGDRQLRTSSRTTTTTSTSPKRKAANNWPGTANEAAEAEEARLFEEKGVQGRSRTSSPHKKTRGAGRTQTHNQHKV